MLRLPFSLVVCFLVLNPAVTAAEETTGLDVDLAKTFSFCQGNRFTLKSIRDALPQLRPQAEAVEKRWDAAFGEAEKNVEVRLKTIAGADWPTVRDRLRDKVLPALKKENEAGVSEEGARRYLELTETRIKGGLDSPIRETLLASHPDFIQEPALEFARGYTGSFSTEGKPGSQGLKLSLKHPLSWMPRDTNTPYTVQKWVCDAGYGMDSMALRVRDLSEISPPAEGLFSEEFGRKLVAEGGLEMVGFETGTVAKMPLGILHFRYAVNQERPLTLRGSVYYFAAAGKFVEVHLISGTPSGAETSTERIKGLRKLMDVVVKSIEVEG